jgi:CheY-like chemotaxis protein
MWPPIRLSYPTQPGARTVLVVENDAAVRDVVETILTDAGYPVLTAGDGIAAFRLFERHPDIALVFTDIVMPKIDGLMLADMAKLRRPDIKVLYTTAFGAQALRQPGYRYGEILDKPFRSDALLAAVRRALEQPSVASKPARPAA